jgi:hypothetical protein
MSAVSHRFPLYYQNPKNSTLFSKHSQAKTFISGFHHEEEIQPLTTRTPRTAQRYQGSLPSSCLFFLFSHEPKGNPGKTGDTGTEVRDG